MALFSRNRRTPLILQTKLAVGGVNGFVAYRWLRDAKRGKEKSLCLCTVIIKSGLYSSITSMDGLTK